MSKSILLRRVELTLSPSQFHTSCRVSFPRLHQRLLPEDSEPQVNNADLEGISRCSRVVIWEPPVSEYCFLHPAISMQLLDSWLQDMLPCELRTGQNPPASCLTVGVAANILMLVAARGCGKSCVSTGPELPCI